MAVLQAGAAYRESRPLLDAALEGYKADLEAIVRRVPDTLVVGRVKTARSLVRKLRDGRRSWESVTDKVGLRVICTAPSDVRAIDDLIQSGPWTVAKREKKSGNGPQELFYPGLHFDVHRDDIRDHLDGPIFCEIQVRTRAQDAWAVASHKLTYKGPLKLSKRMQRAVVRLTALVELFDEEISRAFKKRAKLPNYRPALISEYLDDKYEALCEEVADAAQDLEIVKTLLGSYDEDELPQLESIVDKFVESETGLGQLIRDHLVHSVNYSDRSDWLFTQPEVLLVLERCHSRPYLLLEATSESDLEDVVRATCVAAGRPLPA
ncbi:GTP pyrophosphokinase family protein [Nocardioides sp. CFH 31398]|uniref:GTP pyrophosphokinase n=1 Tax=Nocardioides sp. CFH 31398 TaxID=2919579 RepID=UPI001F06E958|nr:hypothetical protein [Nocardioides sp. CFH 31398]MCH1867093.1 hypothetical protein [Nocardioides sp. CFH 31398]